MRGQIQSRESLPGDSARLQPAHPVDEETTCYILEARKHFEDLRQVASQLAGLLVLTAAGSKSAGPHHPILESACHLYQKATDAIRSTRPTRSARLHHEALLQAAAALSAALIA